MDFLDRMEQAIDYIEAHIGEDFTFSELERIVLCDSHQFSRIFSYVTGIPLGEYIRSRRLSLAALSLREGEKVVDVALRYGYASPEAFARAFRALHGISPRQAAAREVRLRMCPRLRFVLQVKGVCEMEYRIVELGEIHGVGVVRNFGKWSANSEAKTWTEREGEVWKFWDHFLDRGANLIIRDKYKLYRPPFWQMGVNYVDEEGNLTVSIGAEDAGGEYPELTRFTVPAATWAAFSIQATLNQDDHPVEMLLTRIQSEWMPSSGYERAMNYQIEVYGPGNTQNEDYTTELWIPVRKAHAEK
jgi:AraC family transcriptional regulator